MDSIHKTNQSNRTNKRTFRFRFWFALVFLALLAVGIFLGSRVVILAQKILDHSATPISFGEFFMASDKKLIGEEGGEVRFLLMGIGGENHQGGTLTDTMILATLKTPRNEEDIQIGLVSIPRDLVVNIPGYDYRKINSAYAFAELKEEGRGPQAALETVEKVIGEDIPYYAVIDFSGFEQVIDDLNGVDVNVPVTFTDYQYPDKGYGYLPPLTFEAGQQVMDGDRALQYVRSRHGNNGQGSDFARARRQQQIMQAVGNKVRNLNLITDLGLINRLLDDVANNFRTNMELYEMKRLYDITKNFDKNDIISNTIDVESGLVCNEILEESGAYILVPCKGLGQYDSIRKFIDNQFTSAASLTESAVIEIQNSSGIANLSRRTAEFITNSQLEIISANYQGDAAFKDSTIYDNTGGKKAETLNYLRENLQLKVAGGPFPFPVTQPNADFVIIITSEIQNILP